MECPGLDGESLLSSEMDRPASQPQSSVGFRSVDFPQSQIHHKRSEEHVSLDELDPRLGLPSPTLCYFFPSEESSRSRSRRCRFVLIFSNPCSNIVFFAFISQVPAPDTLGWTYQYLSPAISCLDSPLNFHSPNKH